MHKAGYHRRCGEWRKKRKSMFNPDQTPAPEMRTPSSEFPAQEGSQFRAPSSELPASPNVPNPEAPPQTQLTVFPMVPHCDDLEFSDILTENSLELIIGRLGEDQDEKVRDLTREYLRSLEFQFLLGGASPLELVLVRRIVYCFAILQYFETLYAQTMGQSKKNREHGIELTRLNQAHGRYLSAIKALNQVRKARMHTSARWDVGSQNLYESMSTCRVPVPDDQSQSQVQHS